MTKLENLGIKFAKHPIYGFITSCPTNIGTGKRISILARFPNISNRGQDLKRLRDLANSFGL